MTGTPLSALFPQPRESSIGGPGAPAGTPVSETPDDEVGAQGYELHVSDGRIDLRHGDPAGRRHGRSTLEQLRELFTHEMPGLVIRDRPDFAVRAWMLDISRDRVPTMATLEWLIDLLEVCRYNQLQLYTEHTFAHIGHDVVWRDASPLTADEMRTLDRLCAGRGIELVANRNSFGHMERWLRHDSYRARSECPDGWDFPVVGGHQPPGTLAPTPDNAAFALSLVRELASTTSSHRVNIGCDETFELGQGESAAEVDRRGRSAVFVEHLRRIVEPLVAEGHEVQFWGDMLRRDARLIDQLPAQDVVPLVWNYEAPSPPDEGLAGLLAGQRELLDRLGIPPDAHLGFRAHVRAFAESGSAFWVAPGTSSWNTIVGRWDNARANLLDAAEVGRACGCDGYLVTDWGDNGHVQPPTISVLPMAYGAGVAWCGESNRDADAAAMVDRWLLRDAAGELGGVLGELGGLHRLTGHKTVNGSPLFYALLARPPVPIWDDADHDGLAAVNERLEAAVGRIASSKPADAGTAIRDELLAAVRLARQGAWRLASEAGLPAPGDDQLADDLTDAVQQQRAAWLARSRPGGLQDSLARMHRG